jgi:hypothetical protein
MESSQSSSIIKDASRSFGESTDCSYQLNNTHQDPFAMRTQTIGDIVIVEVCAKTGLSISGIQGCAGAIRWWGIWRWNVIMEIRNKKKHQHMLAKHTPHIVHQVHSTYHNTTITAHMAQQIYIAQRINITNRTQHTRHNTKVQSRNISTILTNTVTPRIYRPCS